MNRIESEFTNASILRMKAEEKLKEEQRNIDKEIAEADAKRLLHELQVHQIELEMQNEELQHTYETAELALKKYTMLYDLAPMGYFTLESDGSICELNYAAAEMLEERHFSLLNTNFKLFILPSSLRVFNDFLNRIFTTREKESCNILLGKDEQPVRSVYMEGVMTDEGKQCLLSVVDMTNMQPRQ